MVLHLCTSASLDPGADAGLPPSFARQRRHALKHALQLAAQHGQLEAGRNVGEAVGREAELLQCLGEQIQIQIGSTGRSRLC